MPTGPATQPAPSFLCSAWSAAPSPAMIWSAATVTAAVSSPRVRVAASRQRWHLPGARDQKSWDAGLAVRGESRSRDRSTQSIRRTTLTCMAMGTRETDQPPLWIATSDLPTSPGHPFYARLTTLLDGHHFDRFVEGLCARGGADPTPCPRTKKGSGIYRDMPGYSGI